MRWFTTVEANRFAHLGFSALLMGTALVLTRSRSGMASFAIAVAAFALLAMREFKGRRSRVMVAVYMSLILLGAVAWAGTDDTVGPLPAGAERFERPARRLERRAAHR